MTLELPTAEGVTDVAHVLLDASVPPAEEDGEVYVVLRRDVEPAAFPYTTAPAVSRGDAQRVRLVRYHDWAERAPSTMRIWLPTA